MRLMGRDGESMASGDRGGADNRSDLVLPHPPASIGRGRAANEKGGSMAARDQDGAVRRPIEARSPASTGRESNT